MNHSVLDRELGDPAWKYTCDNIVLYWGAAPLVIGDSFRVGGQVFCSSDLEIAGTPDTRAWKKLVLVSSIDPGERSLWQPEPLVNERIRAVLTWLVAQRRVGTREDHSVSSACFSLSLCVFFSRLARQLPSLSVLLSEARLLADKEGSIARRSRHLAHEPLSREALIKALSTAQV